MIEIDRLEKSYPGSSEAAVKNVALTIERGEFFTLLGPSGCGKTTTLRCIAGLERPDSGVITIDGRVVYKDKVIVPTYQRSIGMVFQSYAVWPHMTVFANVAFPLQVARPRRSRKEIARLVESRLNAVGLGALANRPATNLSGGQQQRLALARALVREPAVLLLDEPLSNLDARLREQMRRELRELQQRLGLTTIFVTHDQVEALSMSDRIGLMKDGQIVQLGSPEEIYDRPNSEFAAKFIGGTNLIPGRIVRRGERTEFEAHFGMLAGEAASPHLDVGQEALAVIKHEHVGVRRSVDGPTAAGAPDPSSNQFRGVVRSISFEGSRIQITVDVGSDVVTAVTEASRRTEIRRGDTVDLSLPADRTRIVAKDGLPVS